MGLLFGLALGIAGARYWLGTEAQQQFAGYRAQTTEELSKSRAAAAQAYAEVDALVGQLVVEESTRKGLEARLDSTQTELGRAREQLAFYDQLLPPGPKGAISIRALDIEQLGPHLQFRVLLMRNAQDDSVFTGRMQFVANGIQSGKAVKITLKAAQMAADGSSTAAAPDSDGLDLGFDRFQRSGGLLSLPPDFIPRTVTLNILEADQVRVSRTVNLAATD